MLSVVTNLDYGGASQCWTTGRYINCPQHIHQRYAHRQIKPVIDGLKARIAELEAALEAERGRHN